MYSLILMMAMNTTGAELPAFGRSFSCDGGCWSCSGCCGGDGCCGGGIWRRGRLFGMHGGCCGGDGCCGGFSCDGGCCGGGCCGGGFFRGLMDRIHGGCCGGFSCDGGCCGGCFGHEITHVPAAPVSPEPPKAAEPAKEKAAMGTAAKATLVVNVPSDARVTIDGEATSSGTNVRVFSTPVLQSGYSYRYILQAEMVVNGQKVIETKAVNVKAGEETRVNFEPTVAMPMPRGEIITRTSNVVR